MAESRPYACWWDSHVSRNSKRLQENLTGSGILVSARFLGFEMAQTRSKSSIQALHSLHVAHEKSKYVVSFIWQQRAGTNSSSLTKGKEELEPKQANYVPTLNTTV
ncbi:uncharacterized protein [Pyrus communis]|uniref:uncharacterized protein n=1 Tax=Pyrus communis TaxID=23211 RepID=UPI0035BF1F5E